MHITNLSPIQRIAVAEKYRPIYEKQAKENLVKAGNNYGVGKNKKPFQKSENPIAPINTTKKLAKTAGVSTDTYSKGKKILDSDNEKLKKEVLSGEIGGSAKKVGKRIKELERLYGIQNGSTSFQGNQYEVVTNKSEAPKKTQEQLAAQMGISVDTLQNYKMLAENKILRLLCRREFCISGIFIRLMGWFINI